VTDVEKAEVVQLGGLHVVGTERHVRPACRARPPAPCSLLRSCCAPGRARSRPATRRARLRACPPLV